MKSNIRIDRRRILLSTVGGGATGLLTGSTAFAQTPAPFEDTRMIQAPRWAFGMYTLTSPYTGTLQVPPEVPAGSQVVAIEVEIVNDSDQALAFTPLDVRLRDAAGTEYRGGAVIGAEPMINPRNLNPGERSRGWVWYVVPEAAELVEVVYIGPTPQFRVPLSQ